MRIEFKFGEVLPADGPLARWIVSLAMIHNDLVFANDVRDDDSLHHHRWGWAMSSEVLSLYDQLRIERNLGHSAAIDAVARGLDVDRGTAARIVTRAEADANRWQQQREAA